MRVEKGKIIIEDGDKLGELKLTKQQQDQLIEQNQKCVGYVIRKHFNFECAMDKDDLFGYGYIGLCKAARDFNINLGNKFSTYACSRIWGEIKMALRDKSGIVGDRETRIKTSSRPPFPFSYYESKYAESTQERSDCCSVTVDEILFNDEDSVKTYDDIVTDVCINELVSRLEKVDQDIFKYYFIENRTQKEVGELVGLTQMSVSRRLKGIKELFDYFKPILV